MNVGTDSDTAAFAVESIRRWWHVQGAAAYPAARRLLITADAGGSNGYRTRAWKAEVAALAAQAGLEITCCHFPPGTPKWDAIEHRLFSHISMNWRGRPLTSHEVIVNTIAATTTATGLTRAAPRWIRLIPGRRQDQRRPDGHPAPGPPPWHGDWDYTLNPRPAPAAAAAPPPAPSRPRGRCDQATLAHPALTGLARHDLDSLITTLALPWNAAQEARRCKRRGGPRPQAPQTRQPPRTRPHRPDPGHPHPPAPIPAPGT